MIKRVRVWSLTDTSIQMSHQCNGKKRSDNGVKLRRK
ncbi:hypothetical protein I3843_08G064700 [Carya illinoinensis]|nr:hypothetical protein I3843_08G064700 [Carya illinoinensis]